MKVSLIFSSFPNYLKSLTERFDIIVGLKEIPIYLRILRRIYFLIPFLNPCVWFSKQLRNIGEYDLIILFANEITLRILKMLSNRFPNTKFIFWYWNPISSSVNPSLVPDRENIRICTFDPEDADLYNIKFVESFSLQTFNVTINKTNEKLINDVYFVGLDKGRAEKLNEFKNICREKNISFKYHLVKDKTSKKIFKNLYSSPIAYNVVIENVNCSIAILDLVQEKQTGLSQRFFESINLNKKIITNNYGVTKTRLYDPNRIFLLGKDDINTLEYFLKTPISPIKEDLLNYYSPENWIERITTEGLSK